MKPLMLTASLPAHPVLHCTLRADAAFVTNLPADSWLLPESAAYAACRAIARSPQLQQQLVPLSYRLRLAKGRKTRRHSLVLSGSLFDCPGQTVRLSLAADAEGIRLTRADFQPGQTGQT